MIWLSASWVLLGTNAHETSRSTRNHGLTPIVTPATRRSAAKWRHSSTGVQPGGIGRSENSSNESGRSTSTLHAAMYSSVPTGPGRCPPESERPPSSPRPVMASLPPPPFADMCGRLPPLLAIVDSMRPFVANYQFKSY